MSIEIKTPVLPESVADAVVLTWHKKPGDPVKQDENLVDLETDKVVLEVPATQDGVLQEILKEEGSTVVANELLATIEAGAVVIKAAKSKAVEATPPPAEIATTNGELPAVSPAVRRLLSENAVPPQHVKGTGKHGRVTRADAEAHIKAKKTSVTATPSAPLAMTVGERVEKRVPMSRLRARIAERLVEAQQTAAMLTTFNEVNMQAVMDVRARYKEQFEKTHGVRLGFMSFFTKAVVEALKRFPAVNASIDGNDVVYHGYYDVGMAVSTDRGLVVPVIRNADALSMADIESTINDFAQRAREGQITMDDMTGGTFTITNGGVFGSLMSTPILNPPQSAILGMHKIEQRAVVENNEVVVRPMMYVALTYDHRIIDGRESVQFLVAIKNLLEDPARLLLQL